MENVGRWCWDTGSRVVRGDVDDDDDDAGRCNFSTPRQDLSPSALATSVLHPGEHQHHHSHKRRRTHRTQNITNGFPNIK